MKKVFHFLVFFLFSFGDVISMNLMTSDSSSEIIKVMLLIKDVKNVIYNFDPYSTEQVVGKLNNEMQYIDFSFASVSQFNQITSLILNNINTTLKAGHKAFFLLLDTFIQKIQEQIQVFINNQNMQKSLINFANGMLKILPTLKEDTIKKLKYTNIFNALIKKFK